MKRLSLVVVALFLLCAIGCRDTLGVGHTFVPPTKAPYTEPVDSVYEELNGEPKSAYGRFSFYETDFNEGYIRLPLDSPYRLFVFMDADGELQYRVYATREIMEDGTAANLEVGYLRAELRERPQPQPGESSYVILIDEGAGFVDTKQERFGRVETDRNRTNPQMPYAVGTDGDLYYPAANGEAYFGAVPVSRLPNGDIVFTLPGGDTVTLLNIAELFATEVPSESPTEEPTPTPQRWFPVPNTPTPAPTDTPEPTDTPTPVPTDTPDPTPGGNENADPTPGGNENADPTPGGNENPDPTPGGNENPDPTQGGNENADPTPGGNENLDPTPGGNENPDPTPGGNENPDPTPGGNENPDPMQGGNENTDPAEGGNENTDPTETGNENNNPTPGENGNNESTPAQQSDPKPNP
ncbi:MAG: hypothetical protein IJL59_10225 [Clostridia bacterium]|nr:hypothetical protein [Clostridia bacterium]